MRSAKQFLLGSLSAALAVTGMTALAATPVQANPAGTGLVINEVYGGGGNSGAPYTNDFVELYNPTDAPIALNGMSLQYRANANVAVSTNVNAFSTGTVPAHGYHLIQLAAGTTVTDKPLPTPDTVVSVSPINLSGTGGQVYLVDGTSGIVAQTNAAAPWTFDAKVIDFVGFGTSAAVWEGTGRTPAPSNTTSISRSALHVDTDNNAADFTTGAPSPENSGPVAPTPVEAGPRADINVNLGQAFPNITLTATGGTPPLAWSAQGLPAGVSISTGGALSGTPTAEGSFPVTATVTDSAEPATSDEVTFTINVAEALETRTIAEVQGTGDRSTFAPATGSDPGQTVQVEGIVTAIYKDPAFTAPSGGFDGFYVQTAGTGGTSDATPDASDAIFVYAGSTSANIPAGVVIGDSVRVIGRVSEFAGTTEITPNSGGVTELGAPLAPVTPREIAFPTTEAAREVEEGMLLAPTDTFTVTNVFDANGFGEIGLATGTQPLIQPTEVADDDDAAALAAVDEDNAARAIALDDGNSVNYLSNQTTKAQPVPYLTAANGSANPAPPRVGAEATLQAPVILEYRNNQWNFQPTSPVTLNGADVVSFEDTRAQNGTPEDVGGDLKIATFNVLNYFNTTGEAYVLAGPQQNPPLNTHCTYYTDRASNRIGNNECGVIGPDGVKAGNGPRGAATAVSLARQEEKLAKAIVAMDADVIGLEEVENSIKLPGETNRDDALARIVALIDALEPDAGWKFVKSPGEAVTASAVAEQDVIRPAFIYKSSAVATVGQSDILFGSTEFANAREPLAQAFKKLGGLDSEAFAVIVNHFKSKGDNANPAPPATGDNANSPYFGAFNGDRVRQATRLVQFADDFAEDRGIEAVFLAGDFNSYTKEDPIHVLETGGFTPIESDDPGDESYSFSGFSGSLDHVLANPAAEAMVTGADIWEINANEAISFQYSRHNYNVTNFWQPNLPFATSDHNPEVVGIDVADGVEPDYKEIQVLGTNDFHGRLLPDSGNAAGAAPYATAVEELRAENPNTVFVAAGDLVGASTFESFIQDDEPTIDALNAMGLEVSAAGNHEFDRGYADFEGRIRDRAAWEYIASNLDYDAAIAAEDRLAETWTKTIDGVEIGFVGAVTEDLPALVNPAGIDGITVTDVVEATNAAAAQLRTEGADLVILLVHEGAPTTDCSVGNDAATTWGNIVQNTSQDVDAIISGHTHLAYNCKYTVEEWADRDVKKRPVVSAGQYGTNLNKLVFKFDEGSGELKVVTQEVLPTAGVGYAPDPDVQAIVDDAVAFAETEGAAVLGQMDGPFKRASYNPSGNATENRGGESTLSNQVAEVQRWATDQAGIETDIAFMNPGGLRADMVGTVNGDLRDLTFRQAADVQPFANTLVNMKLTGAQIETVLEEQWQRTAQGGVPSRPFLRLGVSDGFTYTYEETAETVSVPNSAPVQTFRGEVTGMWLNGEPVDAAQVYSVTVNSFLGGGGDNFWELANGTDKVDTGKVDLEAMVDYMAQFDAADPLPVDYSQRAVELDLPDNAPAAYAPGDTLAFDVSSWAMSAAGDVQDAELQVKLGDEVLGTFAVNNAVGAAPYDSYGTAAVSLTLPAGIGNGVQELTVHGPTTKTSVPLFVQIDDVEDIQIVGTNDFHGRLLVDETPSNLDCDDVLCPAAVLSGTVKQLRTENPNTVFVAAGDLIGASTFESFIQNDEPTIDALNEAGLDVSAAGNHEFDQGYEDLVGRVQTRADWEYIAANVEEPAGRDDLAETWTRDFGELTVGFVGAVTEELPSLVSPAGIEGVTVTDIVDATNAAAAELRADGADVVVLLVHEGSGDTACDSPQFTDENTVWGNISQNVSGDVDAIVSGHTHLAYNCSLPVQQWIDDDRTVTERPVVSAGQYGQNINKLVFSVDASTGEVVAKTQSIVPLNASSPSDPVVEELVNEAKAVAEVQGAVKIGEIAGPFNRARITGSTEPNRGGESTLGNKVAEVQRWATRQPESGAAQIAFMNPGGLRQDMVGTPNGEARDLTYKQAAVVQPFANTLVNMDLTGAQIETVLEQQWQRLSNGTVPSRPFLKLGASDGFTYTYVETPVTVSGVATFQGEVTGMWLNGEPLDPATSYSVTVNSFLGSGGDNFREFANGTGKADTGKVDLQAMVDYLAAFSASEPLAVDYSQRAVEVEFPADAPSGYEPGADVVFDVGSWTMSNPDDVKDTAVEVKLGEDTLGTFALDNTIGTVRYDADGKAAVDVTLPTDIAPGPAELTLVGAQTGTSIIVPIELVEPAPGEVVNDTLPTIVGTAKVGVELTSTPGTWTPADVELAYQWSVGGVEVNGATTATYTPVPADVGKVVTLEVTASAEGYLDGVATSAPTAAVSAGTIVNDTPPTISGTARVGRKLTAEKGTWTPTPAATTLQWLADGVPISGATGSTLTLKAAQVGKKITVRETATATGYTNTAAVSLPTATVVKGTVRIYSRIAPVRIVVKKTKVTVIVRPINADGIAATGTVRVGIGSKVRVGTLSDGVVELAFGVMDYAGLKSVRMRYLGNASLAAQTDYTSFTVDSR